MGERSPIINIPAPGAHLYMCVYHFNQTQKIYLRPQMDHCAGNKTLPYLSTLTGVDIVSRLKLEHGAKPRMMQVRTRRVALREDGNYDARV